MQFTTVLATLTLALGALAAPSPQSVGYNPVSNSATVAQANDMCGDNMDLSCCNKVSQSGDSTNVADGILSGILPDTLQNGELGLFDGCSKLDVAALIGVDDILNSQCKQTAACCQRSGTEQDGLVNLGLPCVALGGLL